MKFEVINSDKECVMCTEHSCCIPFNQLDSMTTSGYRFKIDGKFVSKKDIARVVKCSLQPTSELSRSTDSKSANTSKQVRCKDTGIVYANQSAAARDLGIDPAQVSDSIKTGRPRSGYTFERVIIS